MEIKPHVELLTYTPNADQLVAAASRLCYSGADIGNLFDRITQKDQTAFIDKLQKMGHLSPFEHASFTFGIEGVSRALLAQITRHRIASFSVQSQRYVTMGGSDGFDYVVPPSIAALGTTYADEFRDQMRRMDAWYRGWIDVLGEAKKEDARFVLPNACATRMIVTMNARELLHFFEERCCNRAQWEIRAAAWEMLRLVREVAPALFADGGPSCVRGHCIVRKEVCAAGNPIERRKQNEYTCRQENPAQNRRNGRASRGHLQGNERNLRRQERRLRQ